MTATLLLPFTIRSSIVDHSSDRHPANTSPDFDYSKASKMLCTTIIFQTTSTTTKQTNQIQCNPRILTLPVVYRFGYEHVQILSSHQSVLSPPTLPRVIVHWYQSSRCHLEVANQTNSNEPCSSHDPYISTY